jgi:xylulokinase
MSLLGVDVGTTGCKAIIFRADGKILGQGYEEYPLVHPRPGWSELDPNRVWEAVQHSIAAAIGQAGTADPVRALATSVQGEAVTPVSADGEVLAPSPVTFDARTVPYEEWWAERLGRDRLFALTGMALHPMYSINKIMWWRRERPEIYQRAWKFLCYGDFVLWKLGVTPTIDRSMAGRTMAFDLRGDTWSAEILDAADVDPGKLPEVAPAGTVVGRVPDAVCDQLGLPRGVLAATGGHDQPCGAFGAGISEPGLAMDATGTVECITPIFDAPVLTPAMQHSNYCCYHHVVPGLYASLAFNFTGGSLLRWYRDQFGAIELEEARVAGLDVYDIMIGKAAGGPSSVFVLPHFTMTGTPWFDPHSRGAILGLTLATTREEVLKGLLDGITFEMRLNLDGLQTAGVAVERLRAIGGGAKSRTWMQLKADIFHRPVSSLNVSEAACLGAAMLAGVAAGEYASPQEAARDLVREVETFDPRPEEAARYEESYAVYRELYPTLRELNRRIGSREG